MLCAFPRSYYYNIKRIYFLYVFTAYCHDIFHRISHLFSFKSKFQPTLLGVCRSRLLFLIWRLLPFLIFSSISCLHFAACASKHITLCQLVLQCYKKINKIYSVRITVIYCKKCCDFINVVNKIYKILGSPNHAPQTLPAEK